MATNTDTRTLAELEAAIADGDTSVTGATLAAAREQDRIDQLRAEAEDRRERDDAEAAHRVAVDELRADLLALADTGDELRAKAAVAVAALGDLVDAIQAREPAMRAQVARLKALGIPEMAPDNQPRGGEEIGWRRTGNDGLLLAVGRRRLRAGDANKLLASVLAEARSRARLNPVQPANPTAPRPVDDVIRDLDHEVAPPPADVAIRYLPNRSRVPGGHVERLAPALAAMRVRRGVAEYA